MKATVEIPSKMNERLEDVVEDGYYSPKAEAIRDSLRKLFEDLDARGHVDGSKSQ